MYQLHSTVDVIAETMYHLRRNFPMADGRVTAQIDARLRDSLDEILDDYDSSIPYPGKDPDDRHIHAAVMHCRADILLTSDSGFDDPDVADLLDYEVYSPDDFFVLVDDSASACVQRVTEQQLRYWKSREVDGVKRKGLVDALKDAECPKFAERVETHLRTLSGVKSAKQSAI